MILILVIYLALIVLLIASQWKIFQKAGQPGWACLVPFYNIYTFLKIVGKPTWWMIMFFIPILNIIFAIWATNMLSKSFGKETGFTVGLVMLGFVFYPMLAFGSSVYIGPFGDQKAFELAQNPQFDFEKK